MGTYTHLLIDNYPVIDSKGDVIYKVIALFKENDKKIYKRKVSERNPLVWGDYSKEKGTETVFEYSISVSKMIDRLEAKGFTLKKAEKEFNQEINILIKSIEENITEFSEKKDRENCRILKNASFESFINAFAEIREKKLLPNYSSYKEYKEATPLANYMLNADDDSLLGFPHQNLNSLMRGLLESCNNDSLITQDITDLVANGYYSSDDKLTEIGVNYLLEDYDINSKIIILTEGRNDREILNRSLKLLYPHLYQLYSFLDFGVSNVAGGASSLVSLLKGFVGTGINNRIIALFDNDTAAFSAVRGLKKTKLTKNIKIVHLPKVDMANNYPTVGPTGIFYMDVNELAGSIELYLGRDSLFIDESLVPVQWKGFDTTLKRYQGEIINKILVQKNFFKKLRICEKDLKEIGNFDWTGLRSIFKVIFEAFH